jgi:hypothetical protein
MTGSGGDGSGGTAPFGSRGALDLSAPQLPGMR